MSLQFGLNSWGPAPAEPAIPDSQVTRAVDNSSNSGFTGKIGIVFDPNLEIEGLKAEISTNTAGATTAYIIDSSLTILGNTDISSLSAGDTFRVDGLTLSASTDYYLVLDAGGGDFTVGFYDSPTYPYTTDAFDITGQYNGDNSTDPVNSNSFPSINNIRNLDY